MEKSHPFEFIRLLDFQTVGLEKPIRHLGILIVLILFGSIHGRAQEISYNVSSYQGGNNVSCHGATDGWINLVVVNGQPPYLFNWSNGSFDQNLSGLAAGEYIVVVTDANMNTTSTSIKLNEPKALDLSLSPSVYEGGYNISTNGGNDGHLDAKCSGGTWPYSYAWNTGSTESSIFELSAQTYSVVLTDMNGCTASGSRTLTEPTELRITGLTSPLHNGFNISCNGGNDGAINLTVTGGVTPYTYQWSNGQFVEDPTNLSKGIHWVIIRDANNHAVAQQILLTEPPVLKIESLNPLTYSNGYNIACFGCSNGELSATITGGAGTFLYHWSNGTTTPSITGLPSGNYSLWVEDANGCKTEKAYLELKQPERDDWAMTGNTNSDPSTQYLGTRDSADFVLKTNNTERIRLRKDGIVKINGGLNLSNHPLHGVELLGVDSTGSVIHLGMDSTGSVLHQSINVPFNPCMAGHDAVLTWMQGQYALNEVVDCWHKYGIGVEQPLDPLEVSSGIRTSGWQNQSNYLRLWHDNGNARINTFGTGDLLINYSEDAILVPPKTTFINTGLGGNVELGNSNGYVSINSPLKLPLINDGILFKTNNLITSLSLAQLNYWQRDNIGNLTYSSGKVGINTTTSLTEQFTVNGSAQFLSEANNGVNSFQILLNQLPVRRGISLDDDNIGNINFFIHEYCGQAGFNFYKNNGGEVTPLVRINKWGQMIVGDFQFSQSFDQNFKLFVQTGIRTERLKVDLCSNNNWADYVFNSNYNLMSLDQLSKYININQHLPEVPTTAEVAKEGIDVMEMQILLLKKVEELTLYLINLKNENESIKNQLSELKKQ